MVFIITVKEKVKVNNNWKSYHIPNMPAYMRRPKNCVYMSSANSVEHEISKALASYMLLRWGDVKFSESVIKAVNELSSAVKLAMGSFPPQKADFITEAVPNKDLSRRVDLVRLFDDTRFEFETDHKVKKAGENTLTVYL